MIYDTQGIQQQGRLFEVGEETRGITPERGQGAKRKAKGEAEKERDRNRKRELRRLRKQGLADPEGLRRDPSWLACSKCHAMIGLGARRCGNLVGADPSAVTRTWAKKGIKSNRPNGRRWGCVGLTDKEKAAVDERKEQSRKDAIYNKLLKDAHALTGAMRKAQRKSKPYHAMTPEEKKARNARCMEKRKERYITRPEAKARDKAKIDKWKKDNPSKHKASNRKSVKKRLRIDPSYRAIFNMRSRFKDIMAITKAGGNKHFTGLIGCTTKEFKRHIESKFKKWMTWENYGKRWHIDHIIPCSAFDHAIEAQRRLCWHFTNLRPLCARANMDKSDTITEPQMHLML